MLNNNIKIKLESIRIIRFVLLVSLDNLGLDRFRNRRLRLGRGSLVNRLAVLNILIIINLLLIINLLRIIINIKRGIAPIRR